MFIAQPDAKQPSASSHKINFQISDFVTYITTYKKYQIYFVPTMIPVLPIFINAHQNIYRLVFQNTYFTTLFFPCGDIFLVNFLTILKRKWAQFERKDEIMMI